MPPLAFASRPVTMTHFSGVIKTFFILIADHNSHFKLRLMKHVKGLLLRSLRKVIEAKQSGQVSKGKTDYSLKGLLLLPSIHGSEI